MAGPRIGRSDSAGSGIREPRGPGDGVIVAEDDITRETLKSRKSRDGDSPREHSCSAETTIGQHASAYMANDQVIQEVRAAPRRGRGDGADQFGLASAMVLSAATHLV